ncbi:hypothetical protein SCOR_18000 [Sulfidibacter corallicola]|uniref:Uncharacterized protein n=1 Tax=Sulfidibacter corallicola TaxID=2818388 RepID=A0A8A4TVZ3_SULCO|nr:hypothetical protein [Sulfidibacter corallicola]QTD53653.1 hypothetical protein J3U87_14460 [Sulfidibacter corallicola]
METAELVTSLKVSVQEIPSLKKIKEGFHNPHVKAWKTKLEEVLKDGGSCCAKALATLTRIKLSLSGSKFIQEQTYINQLEALERTLKQTIQTIEFLGRPEDNDILPHWGKPKSQHLAAGHLMVGDEEVATEEITIHEVLDCLVSLAEDSNHLSEGMRSRLIEPLAAILGDDLLQPFLNQKLDVLLGHWPEFSGK